LRVILVLLLTAVVSSCRKPPGEPVFVITPGVPPSPAGLESTASPSETIAVEQPETLQLPPAVTPSDTATAPAVPGVRVISLSIHGSLYASLEAHGCDRPDVISAHLVRCLWWRMNPWRDICAGDSLVFLYADSSEGIENQTVALHYIPVSGSAVQPFSVYLFRKTGDNYPSYFYSDGTEIAELLNTMPISTFEEITGVYSEPRGDHVHGGIDFKAPEGTPVRTARGGVVSRTDWNFDNNGHCVEIAMGGGYSEIFLHLSSIAPGVAPGASIAAGAPVGAVGSTGHSYAPHLHYQINDENGYPIDPVLFFGTHQRVLDGADLTAFRAFRDRCDGMMSAGGLQ